MRIAWSSRNPGKECIHLERTKRGKPYTKPAVLTSTSLQDMLNKGLMSSEWGVKCEELSNAAKNLGVDSVFPVYFKDEGYSEQWHFFSVFTNETDNWCQFGRTRVTFDAVAGQWNCQCRGTGETSGLKDSGKQPPPCFIPTENTCPYCPGPTPPALNPSTIRTTQAMVYGMNYVKEGVSVVVKECPVCASVVRFQEYSSGFHNFNIRVILTLPLCELLLSGLALQNKTTSGRMLDTLSFFNDNRYHHQVVGDANWKLAFDVPLGTLKRPDP
ncbi:hypothetical protein ABVT39_006702 [Epinephelus coioides]